MCSQHGMYCSGRFIPFIFCKMADEKNYYEKQLIALEQQAKVQYEYYLTQAKKYDQTIQILHDVNKHIKAIEGLYGAEQEKRQENMQQRSESC